MNSSGMCGTEPAGQASADARRTHTVVTGTLITHLRREGMIMRSRMLTTALTIALVLGAAGIAGAGDPGEFFTDAAEWEDEFFAESAYWLGRMGIFIGDAEANLLPGDPLTRAQMAVILSRMTGQEQLALSLSSHSTTWTDDALIPSWARGYMVLAEAREWFIGHPDGSVGPNDHLTFAQIAVLLARVTDNEDLAVGPWPASALIAADAMELFEDIDFILPDMAILRSEMVSATLRAMVTETYMNRSAADGGPDRSLMEQHYGEDYEEWAEDPDETVTGEWTAYLPVSQRVTVGGITYPLAMDGDNVDVHVVVNDYTWHYMGFQSVYRRLGGEQVELTLNSDGEVSRVEAMLDTYPDAQLHAVETIEDEEDFGTITVDWHTLNVDDETVILLDGAPASLAGLQAAFDAFTERWGTDWAIATVRTLGDQEGDGMDAIWVSVITERTVEGELTMKGTDSTGPFVRIDGVRYHYLLPLESDDFVAGQSYILLLDSRDRARAILEAAGAAEESEFFGMLVNYEMGLDDRGTATFAFSDGTERDYGYDGALWTLIPDHVDRVWYVVHDGTDFTTLVTAGGATSAIFDEELVTVADTYIRTFDGVSTTTLILSASVFAWDGAEYVEVVDLLGFAVNVYVDSEGRVGFVAMP